MLQNVKDLLDSLPLQLVNRFIPVTWGIAFFIFVGFWLFRGVIARYFSKTLLRLAGKTKTTLDEHIVRSFEKPLNIFFAILGIYLALLYLPLKPEHDIILSHSIRSAVVILLSIGMYNFLGSYDILHQDLKQFLGIKLDHILIPFFSKVLRVIIILLALSIVAQEWGFQVTSFIAGLGLGGLAFALAAKDMLANIFGGIVIITDKPFSIGDWILTPSVEGTVEDINFRSTKVRTFAQALVTVPNATLAEEAITNWTRMGIRRISFKLGVTYTTPRDKLKSCIEKIRLMLETHPEIYQEFLVVRFDSFGDSSLDILLYFFTNTTDYAGYLRVKEDINFKIMEILEQEDVIVAFPSTSIYFETPLETTDIRNK